LVPVPAEITEEDLPEFLTHPEEPHPGDEIFEVLETEDGKFLEQDLEVAAPDEEHHRLTHRLHGKQPWPPVLRSMRTGGEWALEKKNDEEYLEECRAQCKDVKVVYNL